MPADHHRDRALLRLLPGNHDRTAVPLETEYRSRFTRWDSSATVRSRPQRRWSAEPGSVFFPPELVPPLAHPLLRSAPAETTDRYLVLRLHEYLQFTTDLENVAVLPVAASLSRGVSGLNLSVGMRRDAFRIVTDEAWHAQFSFELSEQVREHTGIGAVHARVPSFVTRLDRIRSRLAPELQGIEMILFAIASETMLSMMLATVPHDTRLPTAVRQTVADHAHDEGRHHAYFKDLLERLWHRLTRTERIAVGCALPEMIRAFLEPDYESHALGLLALGFTSAEAEQIVAESFPASAVAADCCRGAGALLRYLSELGAMDDPATASAFGDHGLSPGST